MATAAVKHMRQRLAIEIQGAVQGVGFRPFVYRLASGLGLGGWVLNDARGVFIEVEGEALLVARFAEVLEQEPPPLARIQSMVKRPLAPLGEQNFAIRHSSESGLKTVLVLPDVATCPDCLRETLDPSDRRYCYPFTNCTNCGPRFSIVRALPYDRPNTTMSGFQLCEACRAEYEDPLDRRFHAQPNACAVCGPQLELWPGAGGALAGAAQALREGKIVAVKGLGGFHLMCDARDAAAVALLRARKQREEKPFALMVRDLEQAAQLCDLDETAVRLLTAPAAPIVLLPKKRRGDHCELPQPQNALIAEGVAPGNPYLGVMLPATPLHHLLLRAVDFPLVATSGNLSDEPICTDEHEVSARLGGIADCFLVHNRPIERHVDDSIVAVVAGEARLVRRARGYAPLPVLLKRPAPTILAVGAHLKNSVALSVGRQVFISQHIGDLATPEAIAAFERVIADFLRLYEATPVAIVHDLHPDYYSSHYVRHYSATVPELERIAIQHHHAHFAACLAENGLDGPALGVIWDGTGLGTDGTIWGGEFLAGGVGDAVRLAYLRPFRLPGGDAAAREARRAGLALLWELEGPAMLEREDLLPLRSFNLQERLLIGRMLERGLNTPLTSSAGRLFDGVAALIGLRQRSSFEGQAAMELEFAADSGERGSYPFETAADDSTVSPAHVVDWRPALAGVLEDLQRGIESSKIAARFHNTLVEMILHIAQIAGLPQVALSGGCFQNRLLTERAAQRLSQAGFTVILHHQVPPNDGGISLGQAAAAAARFEAGTWR